MENKFAFDSLLIWFYVIAIGITMVFKFNRFESEISQLKSESIYAKKPTVVCYSADTNKVAFLQFRNYCSKCGNVKIENIPIATMLDIMNHMVEQVKERGAE